MRILILTFYYKPDLSACSFRAAALSQALMKQYRGKLHIDVFTTLPNRYHSFDATAPLDETIGNIHIKRFKIPKHKSGMFDQAKAFLSFSFQVVRAFRRNQYDIIFATSSRLMTAMLGAILARYSSTPLYLDIRDIFTETMQNLLNGHPLRLVIPLLKKIELFTLRSAVKVNVVSRGFLEYFQKIVPKQHFSIFTNGIDDEFIGISYNNPEKNPVPIILYAGNIGEGQGLHHVLPEAAKHLKDKAEFLLVGDGGARYQLEKILEEKKIKNIKIKNPIPRTSLIKLYSRADFLFLHLNDHRAFHKVLPSKIFEYAATGKPILAGVDGYARSFILSHIENAFVFEPCNPMGLVEGFKNLQPRIVSRNDFIHRFSRKRIMLEMAKDILNCVSELP